MNASTRVLCTALVLVCRFANHNFRAVLFAKLTIRVLHGFRLSYTVPDSYCNLVIEFGAYIVI